MCNYSFLENVVLMYCLVQSHLKSQYGDYCFNSLHNINSVDIYIHTRTYTRTRERERFNRQTNKQRNEKNNDQRVSLSKSIRFCSSCEDGISIPDLEGRSILLDSKGRRVEIHNHIDVSINSHTIKRFRYNFQE